MKLFNVTINNNPGGWKSGSDPHVLVLAESGDEAISLVKNGWGHKYKHDEECYVYGLGDGYSTPYISHDAIISAIEVIFDRRQVNLNKLLV